MRKSIHILLAFLMLAGLLTGCGDKASQDTDASPSDSGAAQDTSYTETSADDALSVLLDTLFPETTVRMGMTADQYPEEASEPGTYLTEEPCRYLLVTDGIAASIAELYFMEESGLSHIQFSNPDLTEGDLELVCGNPMLYRGTETGTSSYWMLGDVLMVYTDEFLQLFTEDCARQICPTNLTIAKTGLLLFDSGFEDIYWYQDIQTWKYGLYDALEDSMLTDACYDDFGQFDPAGMAPVQQDGYWGYINASGETIIGHYFENAESFVGECAIVGGSGNWGAIDRAGNYLVQPEYHRITIQDGFLIVYKSGRYGAFDAAGQSIVPVSGKQDYEDITICNGILYAQYAERSYHAYDENGDRLLPEAKCVTLPKNGFHIVRMPYESIYGWTTSGYTFADVAFNVLGTTLYDELTDFSAAGYAVGSNNWESFDVIDTQGNVVYTLPELNNGDGITNYEYANSYLACGHYSMGTSFHYGVTNLETGIFTEYDVVEPVDGTECMIVTADSGLKGLYERDELAFDCVYDEISFSDGVFHLTRGAESKTYEPA